MPARHGGIVHVVVTAEVLGSIVEAIGGKHVQIDALVPSGASPETFEPTPHEITLVHDARLLVENGAGYETWVVKVMRSASNANLHTAVLSLGVKKLGDNPHLWMDPARARVYAKHIRTALIAVDPQHAADYRRNDLAYEHSLRILQKKIIHELKAIPKSHRNIITSHDAWSYFAQRFGLKVLGVVETAPGREPNAEHLARLVRIARANGVTSVFSEASESPKLSQALAGELMGGRVIPLYVDTLNSKLGITDYRTMMWFDTMRIVAALKEYTPVNSRHHVIVPKHHKTPKPGKSAAGDDLSSDDDSDFIAAPPLKVSPHKSAVHAKHTTSPKPQSDAGDIQ